MDIKPYRPGQQLTPAAPLDVAVAPGETLREVLDELQMTQIELAGRIGASTKHVNQVVKGIVPLSADVAQRLENATGVAARLWSRLESDYRTALAHEARENVYASTGAWISDVPVRAFVNAGILPKKPNDPTSRVDQVLRFFGVASLDALRTVTPVAAFRKSGVFEQDDFAVAAWLRIGELAARSITLPEYSAAGLSALLPELRALTTDDPSTALPRLAELVASVGVALVFVPEVEGARAYGATYWINAKRPVIQLGNRGRTLDKLWETFFHELGHVLLHDRRDVFIDDEDECVAAEEREATAFSRATLLPNVNRGVLESLATESDVSKFAEHLDVHAGIIVAELQRQGLWDYAHGRNLRRSLAPTDLPSAPPPRIPSVRPSRLQWRLPGTEDE